MSAKLFSTLLKGTVLKWRKKKKKWENLFVQISFNNHLLTVKILNDIIVKNGITLFIN